MKVVDYWPINCKPCNAGCVQEMLAAQHWETARSLDRRRMWITGLYLGGVAYSAINCSPVPFYAPDIGYFNYVPDVMRILLLVMFIAGIVAFLAVLKLHYLIELHMAKAQVYVGGVRRGIIFDFHIKEGEEEPGEDPTLEGKCILLSIFFKISILTVLYSIVIFCAAFMCAYFLWGPWNCDLPYWMRYTGFGALLVISYFVIWHFESALKTRAREKARYNLSEGFHDVRRPVVRSQEV